MKYTVVFEKTSRYFSAYVPDLPGCVATGATRKEFTRRIQEAIDFPLEGMREDGEPIPEPQASTILVEV